YSFVFGGGHHDDRGGDGVDDPALLRAGGEVLAAFRLEFGEGLAARTDLDGEGWDGIVAVVDALGPVGDIGQAEAGHVTQCRARLGPYAATFAANERFQFVGDIHLQIGVLIGRHWFLDHHPVGVFQVRLLLGQGQVFLRSHADAVVFRLPRWAPRWRRPVLWLANGHVL